MNYWKIGCSVIAVIALLLLLVVVKWTRDAVDNGLEVLDEKVTTFVSNARKSREIDARVKEQFGIDVDTGFGRYNGTPYLFLTLKNQTLPGDTHEAREQFIKTLGCYYWQTSPFEGYAYLEIRLETFEESAEWEGSSTETWTFQHEELMAKDWCEGRGATTPTAEPEQEEAPQKPKRKRREPYTVN